MRDFASPVTLAALAAEEKTDSSAGRAVEGRYSEINSSAADVNCAASVAWRFSCSVANAVKLRTANVMIEDNIAFKVDSLLGYLK
jgi:hypothetical protein